MPIKLTALRAQRELAELSIAQLAHLANSSDLTVRVVENGGTCDEREGARLVNVLGISKATAGWVDTSLSVG